MNPLKLVPIYNYPKSLRQGHDYPANGFVASEFEGPLYSEFTVTHQWVDPARVYLVTEDGDHPIRYVYTRVPAGNNRHGEDVFQVSFSQEDGQSACTAYFAGGVAPKAKVTSILGTAAEVAEMLRPGSCPLPRDTGIYIAVTAGTVTLHGECSGPTELTTDSGNYNLDPNRLTESEWRAVTGTGAAFSVHKRTTPKPLFTLQKWVRSGDSEDVGAFHDIRSAAQSFSAETRFRAKSE